MPTKRQTIMKEMREIEIKLDKLSKDIDSFVDTDADHAYRQVRIAIGYIERARVGLSHNEVQNQSRER